MRSFRHELLSTATVLSIPAAVIIAFPYEGLSFRARSVPAVHSASASFVTLTDEQESSALVAAKTAWQSETSARQRMRFRLALDVLPDEDEGPLIDIDALRYRPEPPAPFAYCPQGWEPSLRAAPPVRLPSEPVRNVMPAFSREELLEMK